MSRQIFGVPQCAKRHQRWEKDLEIEHHAQVRQPPCQAEILREFLNQNILKVRNKLSVIEIFRSSGAGGPTASPSSAAPPIRPQSRMADKTYTSFLAPTNMHQAGQHFVNMVAGHAAYSDHQGADYFVVGHSITFLITSVYTQSA